MNPDRPRRSAGACLRLFSHLGCWSGLLAAGLALSHVSVSAAETTPVFFNDDGDFTFVGEGEAEWRANLTRMLAPLPAVPVSGLVYALGTGTDVLLYPSEAGSSWGWRKSEVPERLGHIRNFPRAVQAGLDGVRWAADDAKALGLSFVPAFRMNDAHYTTGVAGYLEGEFWAKNRERVTFGEPPFRVGKLSTYRELLDFSHAEVREHRLAVIREAIARYGDTMDGLLLDFMRTPVFFTPETAEAKAPLMTDLVAEVRAALDKAEGANGRKIQLWARVPPTLHNAEKTGLDVKTWLERGLVQVVLPSQSMTLAQDTALAEFQKAARKGGGRVFASIYERTAYTFEFRRQAPVAEDYAGRDATAALLRGAAINFRAMGADGFEFYNFNLPLRETQVAGLAAFARNGGDFSSAPRTYAITPAYFVDYLDAFEPPKQLPAKLEPSPEGQTFRMFVGEPAEWRAGHGYAGLRIGFVEDTDAPRVMIWLNGVRIENTNTNDLVSRPGVAKAPRSYRQWELGTAADALRTGWNEIRVVLDPVVKESATVLEIQLGFLPEAQGSESITR